AYNLASQVLTSSPSHFAVVPSDEITTYFTGTGSYDENPETIFEIEQNSAYSLGVNAHPGVFYSNQGNHKGLLVRSWVYDLFDDTDLRQGLFLTAGTFASDDPTGYWTRKYPRKDRKSTRLNSSHVKISYAVFCLKKKNNKNSVDY